MKTLLLIASFFLTLNSYANPQVTSSSSAQHRAVDISHLMKKPEPLPEDTSTGLHLNVSCKTESGKEVSNKDKDYNDCMQRAASKATYSVPKNK